MYTKVIASVVLIVALIGGIIIFESGNGSSEISATIKANNEIDEATIYYNDPVKLSWESENANYCEISGDLEGTVPDFGSQLIQEIKGEKTYILKCFNEKNEMASSSVVVRIGEKPISVINEELVSGNIISTTTPTPVLGNEPINEPVVSGPVGSAPPQVTPPIYKPSETPVTTPPLVAKTPIKPNPLTSFYKYNFSNLFSNPFTSSSGSTNSTSGFTSSATNSILNPNNYNPGNYVYNNTYNNPSDYVPTLPPDPVSDLSFSEKLNASKGEPFGGFIITSVHCGSPARNWSVLIQGEHGGRFIFVYGGTQFACYPGDDTFTCPGSLPEAGMYVFGKVHEPEYEGRSVDCFGAGGTGERIQFLKVGVSEHSTK